MRHNSLQGSWREQGIVLDKLLYLAGGNNAPAPPALAYKLKTLPTDFAQINAI